MRIILGTIFSAALLCAGTAAAQTQTCTPCANDKQYCGVIDDATGQWESGAYQSCTVVLTPPPAPGTRPPAVAQGCSPCVYGVAFCGYYQIQTRVWLSGQWLSCYQARWPVGPRGPWWPSPWYP